MPTSSVAQIDDSESQPKTVKLNASQAPVLFVVVDTEEERTWGTYSRSEISVNSISRVEEVQRIFDAYSIRPSYVIDYPVASQKEGFEPLRQIVQTGRAVIGAHLHPWVNPPHDEEVCSRNTYPCNLLPNLEAAKLRVLAETIETNLGSRPTIYKAGRYGIGKNTPGIMEALGFEIDVSVSPPFDYGVDGGPDFSAYTAEPYWFGKSKHLLEIPVTGAFVGFMSPAGRHIYPLISKRTLRWARLTSICSRTGALDRLRLSPEGYRPSDHILLTRALLSTGVRTFTWSFHSPSLEPGYTPYVRNGSDLERFLNAFRRYFDYFFGELGGIAMTPTEFRRQIFNK